MIAMVTLLTNSVIASHGIIVSKSSGPPKSTKKSTYFVTLHKTWF